MSHLIMFTLKKWIHFLIKGKQGFLSKALLGRQYSYTASHIPMHHTCMHEDTPHFYGASAENLSIHHVSSTLGSIKLNVSFACPRSLPQ